MSENRYGSGSDLAKVDAHDIGPGEYAEIPELDDAWFGRAVPKRDGQAVRRGRPRSDRPKQLLTLRLDPDVIAAWQSTGPGWQVRMGEVLAREARRQDTHATRPGGADDCRDDPARRRKGPV